jgi:RNA polymerase sigma-70 factor (ECF subfamily)
LSSRHALLTLPQEPGIYCARGAAKAQTKVEAWLQDRDLGAQMNSDEVNWLLETIADPEKAKRFVRTQHERGRIPQHAMAKLAREHGWTEWTIVEKSAEPVAMERASARPSDLSGHQKSFAKPARPEGCERSRGDGEARDFPLEAKEEREFVAAAQDGDSEAFEILCKQSATMAFSIARRITKTREDAEDVVQESFQSAFMNLKKFNGGSKFSTWLTRIVTNAALMRLRKDRVRRELPLAERPEHRPYFSPHDVEDQGPNPEQLYTQKERHRMLVKAVNALDPGLRRAMELRELHERSTSETAAMLGVPLGTLKAQLFRGRRKLRQLFQRMESAQLTHKVDYGWGQQIRYGDSD